MSSDPKKKKQFLTQDPINIDSDQQKWDSFQPRFEINGSILERQDDVTAGVKTASIFH